MRFLRSHMGKRVVVAGRCLAAAGCFLALALVATPVTAQVVMQPFLMAAGVVPADSARAYSTPFSQFFAAPGAQDTAVDILATAPDENDDGVIDNSLMTIVKDGGTISVIDWVLIQLRVVPEDGQIPDEDCQGTVLCRDQVAVVTKAALLLSDGSVTSADADNLAEGVLEFDDVEFDPDTQDMYIAINHRNHLPMLSGKVDEELQGGVYVYDDFVELTMRNILTGFWENGVRGGIAVDGILAATAGDASLDSILGDDDRNEVVEATRDPVISVTNGYYQADIDMSSLIGSNDRDIFVKNESLVFEATRGTLF